MHMNRFLSGIVSCTLLLCGGALAQDKSYKVMMILFRGTTQAETGFMDHLRGRLPVEFLVRDVAGVRGKAREFVEEARRERVDLIYTFGTSVTLDVVGATGPGRLHQGGVADGVTVVRIKVTGRHQSLQGVR